MSRGPEVSPCVKWSLFFFNCTVLLAGLLALGVGIYGRLLQNDFGDVANISTDPAILLIVGGVVCTILGAAGTIGALRENILLLKIYYFGIVLVILLEIAAGVVAFVFQKDLSSKAADKMLEGITMYRTTNEQTNLDDAIEAIQETFCCCGAFRPRDWIQNNIYYNCTQETFRRIPSACGVPPSCCRSEGRTHSQCGYVVFAYEGQTPEEQAMWPRIERRDDLIYSDGCETALLNWIKSHYVVIGSIAAGILLLQVVSVFMAVSLKNSILDILNYEYASRMGDKRVV